MHGNEFPYNACCGTKPRGKRAKGIEGEYLVR